MIETTQTDEEKRRGPQGRRRWTPEEDAQLRLLMAGPLGTSGRGSGGKGPNWTAIGKRIRPLPRSCKQVRDRWMYLGGHLHGMMSQTHRRWTAEEEHAFARAHAVHGNQWTTIQQQESMLSLRTPVEMKNHFLAAARAADGKEGDALTPFQHYVSMVIVKNAAPTWAYKASYGDRRPSTGAAAGAALAQGASTSQPCAPAGPGPGSLAASLSACPAACNGSGGAGTHSSLGAGAAACGGEAADSEQALLLRQQRQSSARAQAGLPCTSQPVGSNSHEGRRASPASVCTSVAGGASGAPAAVLAPAQVAMATAPAAAAERRMSTAQPGSSWLEVPSVPGAPRGIAALAPMAACAAPQSAITSSGTNAVAVQIMQLLSGSGGWQPQAPGAAAAAPLNSVLTRLLGAATAAPAAAGGGAIAATGPAAATVGHSGGNPASAVVLPPLLLAGQVEGCNPAATVPLSRPAQPQLWGSGVGPSAPVPVGVAGGHTLQQLMSWSTAPAVAAAAATPAATATTAAAGAVPMQGLNELLRPGPAMQPPWAPLATLQQLQPPRVQQQQLQQQQQQQQPVYVTLVMANPDGSMAQVQHVMPPHATGTVVHHPLVYAPGATLMQQLVTGLAPMHGQQQQQPLMQQQQQLQPVMHQQQQPLMQQQQLQPLMHQQQQPVMQQQQQQQQQPTMHPQQQLVMHQQQQPVMQQQQRQLALIQMPDNTYMCVQLQQQQQTTEAAYVGSCNGR